MLQRYTSKKINKIWNKYDLAVRWKDIEILHLEALYRDGIIPETDLNIIKSKIHVSLDRWQAIENVTKHDLQAFVQMLEESVDGNEARWLHYGLTSSDIIDTATTIGCLKSLEYTMSCLKDCMASIDDLTSDSKNNIQILGRTHGRVAETYSLQLLFKRWRAFLHDAYKQCQISFLNCRVGKLSGPCGNNSTNSKKSETDGLHEMEYSLRSDESSSQIVWRGIYLDYFYALLKCTLAFEKISYDIRHYAIEGIDEMAEGFTPGQKGSSAMPHKKNPILTENLCGLARMCKGYFQVAVDNCNTLWERDISHSSAERIIFPDMAHLTCFGLERLKGIIDNLYINYDNIQRNASIVYDKVSSQRSMNTLIRQGSSRKEAHDEIQKQILLG